MLLAYALDAGTATIIAAIIAAGGAVAGTVLTHRGNRDNQRDHNQVYTHVVRLHDKVDHVNKKVDAVRAELQDHVDWEMTTKYNQDH